MTGGSGPETNARTPRGMGACLRQGSSGLMGLRLGVGGHVGVGIGGLVGVDVGRHVDIGGHVGVDIGVDGHIGIGERVGIGLGIGLSACWVPRGQGARLPR